MLTIRDAGSVMTALALGRSIPEDDAREAFHNVVTQQLDHWAMGGDRAVDEFVTSMVAHVWRTWWSPGQLLTQKEAYKDLHEGAADKPEWKAARQMTQRVVLDPWERPRDLTLTAATPTVQRVACFGSLTNQFWSRACAASPGQRMATVIWDLLRGLQRAIELEIKGIDAAQGVVRGITYPQFHFERRGFLLEFFGYTHVIYADEKLD